MPKRQNEMTLTEQSQRFIDDAQRMINDGELSPTDAEAAVDRLENHVTIKAKPQEKQPVS